MLNLADWKESIVRVVLAGIVAIRTFLSFSLEVEIEGRWPCARPEVEPPGGSRGV
jgi:hypothetical protein